MFEHGIKSVLLEQVHSQWGGRANDGVILADSEPNQLQSLFQGSIVEHCQIAVLPVVGIWSSRGTRRNRNGRDSTTTSSARCGRELSNQTRAENPDVRESIEMGNRDVES